MAFPPEFVEQLRERITLSEVVGRRVALKRKGREYAGLCPFHGEKTPSFWVNDQKEFYHCFGCGAHGDGIGFVMRIDGLGFPEAVERLAGELGMDVPVASPQERERAERAASLHQVTEAAAHWFEQQLYLPVGKAGLAYFKNRGLDDATIKRFRLGFAPDNRESLQAALKREGITEDQLVETGLVIRPEDGGRQPYDRFRGRVMFPIHDRKGRVIAFGGRVIGEGEPKYLNSPETTLFHKGDNLYCLHLAREAAHKDKPVIVAEGYMDVIALHVAGFEGAVAPLGTALTEGQLGLLWRMADEPALCFDGDNAGRRAATRAAERALPLLKPGKSLKFLALPTGEDPDSLIRGGGAAAFDGVLATARPLVDIVWELDTLDQPDDTPERRARIQAAVMGRMAQIADPVVQEYYRDAMRQRLRARRGGNGPAGPRDGRGAANRPGGRRVRLDQPFRKREPTLEEIAWFPTGKAVLDASHDLDSGRRERRLLGALLARPDWLHDVAEDLAALPMQRPDHVRLRATLLEAASDGDHDPVAVLAAALDRARLSAIADSLRRDGETWLATPPPEGIDDLGRWRRAAAHHRRALADAGEVAAAQTAFAADPTEDEWERLRVVFERAARSPRDGEDAA